MGTKVNKFHFAWLVLIGLCITVGLGKSGLNNSAGLFLSPVSQDLGVGIGNLTLYFSIASIVTMVFLPIGGKLMAKYDTRVLLSIAIILQGGAFALFGLMNSVWGWYVLSIPLAVGGVLITVLAGPVLVNQWFKKRSGMALGIITAAGGLIGAFTQPLIGQLIGSQGWRSAYIIVGIAAIIIIVPTIVLLLRKSPSDKGLMPYGAEENEASDKGKEKNSNQSGITFADAKKSIAFALLTLFFFFITSIASFSIHIPSYLMNQGFSIEFTGNVMAAMMVGVLVGSILFGYLIDKIGAKNTAVIAMTIGLVSIMLLLFFVKFTVAIVAAVGLFGFVSASIGTIAPAITSALFGNRDYSQIYSTASVGLAVAGIIALPLYGYIFDFTGSYTLVLYTLIAMLITNIVCVFIAFTNKEKMVKAGLWK
ncbi:MFS transporter [Sporosarcina sp. YIM B06819]|uniref:MFS transporter n=1 Tax=Sporosarcina sp. YIM B06819 TaxID=3081769 RepID=UPI00298CC116|nr:MFS transporter [Sporosarcina sp. YIM B06819]